MSALLLAWTVRLAATEPTPEAPARPPIAEASAAPSPAIQKTLACDQWKAEGLMEGPVAVGYYLGDMTLGRRACFRTEVGAGSSFGAIIDTPNFYGNLELHAAIFGSWAFNANTEVFAHFNVYDYFYTVNAVISDKSEALGDLTVGLSRRAYQTETFAGAVTARLLLPTASNIPGNRNAGAEIGHNVTFRPQSYLELHGWAGVGFTAGITSTPLPSVQVVGLLGAQLSPTSWLSFVADISGGLAGRTFFAPCVAMRFRIFNLGIEVSGTRPLLGDDRHTLLGNVRLAWRI
jgi:hypothetical protein